MGQQQLLLIVLGVIVVGIAIAAGMGLFSASKESSIKDELVAQNVAIAAAIQQYYSKPTSMGGGNLKFDGYILPVKMKTTTNGSYDVGTPTGQTATITAKVLDNKYSWTVVTTVNADTSVSTAVGN
jgi:type II secretory pathway pseudopilin PulG